jgi:hypothetical protein
MNADARFPLGKHVTNGELTGKVVMFVKYSTQYAGPAVVIELLPAAEGYLPVDVVVSPTDASWRPVVMVAS